MYIQEFRDDVMIWASIEVERMRHMRGFPETDTGVTAIIRSILRITHPALVSLRASHVPLTDGAIQGALETGPHDLDKIALRTSRGPVKPLTWLVDAAVERWVFMPAPVELRQIFIDEVGPAADGEAFVAPARAKAEVTE